MVLGWTREGFSFQDVGFSVGSPTTLGPKPQSPKLQVPTLGTQTQLSPNPLTTSSANAVAHLKGKGEGHCNSQYRVGV